MSEHAKINKNCHRERERGREKKAALFTGLAHVKASFACVPALLEHRKIKESHLVNTVGFKTSILCLYKAENSLAAGKV